MLDLQTNTLICFGSGGGQRRFPQQSVRCSTQSGVQRVLCKPCCLAALNHLFPGTIHAGLHFKFALLANLGGLLREEFFYKLSFGQKGFISCNFPACVSFAKLSSGDADLDSFAANVVPGLAATLGVVAGRTRHGVLSCPRSA